MLEFAEQDFLETLASISEEKPLKPKKPNYKNSPFTHVIAIYVSH